MNSPSYSGFDWRLLAALAYQESLWDPQAISPTGVKRLIMLTNHTARQLGISDRTDPSQSISAGAAYLRRTHARIPDRIPEPTRLGMISYAVFCLKKKTYYTPCPRAHSLLQMPRQPLLCMS